MRPRTNRAHPAGRLILLGVLACGLRAPAQDSAPPPEAREFSERVEVEVVNVDVLVTDRKDRDRRRVLDLGKDDFELFVDGRAVPIEYFAPPRAGAAASSGSPGAAGAATVPDSPAIPAAPTNLILYIDETALAGYDRKTAIQELREFLRRRPQGADRVTVAVFEQGLRVLLTPTTDPAAVEQALDEIESRRSPAEFGLRERIHLRHRVRDVRGGDSEVWMIEQEIAFWAEQEIDRQRRSISALAQMTGSFAGVEGRKVVVLATAGIEANPAQYLLDLLDLNRRLGTSTEARRGPSLELRGQTLLAEFEEMIRRAQNARVTFYCLSPPSRPVEGGAEFRTTGPETARAQPRNFGPAEAAASIVRLARATGGASFPIWGDLDRRLEGMTTDLDAAYSLGFSTGAEARDKDHRIEVKVRRPNLAVRHRESFRRRSAPDLAAAALAAAATLGQIENPLEISVSLGPGKPEGKKRSPELVPISIGLPLRRLSLVTEGDERRGSVSIRVAIRDARGRLLDSDATVVPIVVPEDDLERALASVWFHRAALRLFSGRQRIAVAVIDQVSGVQSTVFEELELPAGN